MKKFYIGLFLLLSVVVLAPKVRAATMDDLLNEVASLKQQLAAYQVKGQVEGVSTSDAASTTVSQNLSVGLKNNSDVKNLQTYLKKGGFLPASAAVDGSFGQKTLAAVKALQLANNISENGVVGVDTRSLINGTANIQILCTPTTAPWIRVTSPNGGEIYQMGQSFTPTWSTCNIPSTNNVAIVLQDVVGQSATTLGSGQATDGSVLLSLPNQAVWAQGLKYKILIRTYSQTTGMPIEDTSNNLFTISPQQTACVINSFVANPTTVSSGGSSMLSWTTTGCSNQGMLSWTSGGSGGGGVVNSNGSQTTGPLTATTVYTITFGNVTSTVTVVVGGTTTSCVISNFSASPLNVPNGGSATLTWNTTNCVSANISVTAATAPGGLGQVNTSGSANTGAFSDVRTYILTAYGANGVPATSSLNIVYN